MSYTDYPQSATNNAKRAIAWVEKNGWGTCGEATGKARARQLANREPISRDTIARMASFKRQQQHKDVPYSEGCGGLMWDAWGGTSGVEWASNKLNKIDMKEQINTLLRAVGLKAVEVKFETMPLSDGQAVLEAEVFEAGQAVSIINEDERIPLPLGKYEMEDDMILTVEEEGIIASYEPKAEEEEVVVEKGNDKEEEVEASKKPMQTAVAKKIVESVETYFSAEEKATLIAELKAQILAELSTQKVEEVELTKPIKANPENVKPIEQVNFSNKEVSMKSMIYDMLSK